MEVMSTVQRPNIISISIFLLPEQVINTQVKFLKQQYMLFFYVAYTWQIQQGSWSDGDSISMNMYFFCFIIFIIISSLSPVLTSPMRSSSANNS